MSGIQSVDNTDQENQDKTAAEDVTNKSHYTVCEFHDYYLTKTGIPPTTYRSRGILPYAQERLWLRESGSGGKL